jgi:hypothetical protein
MRSVIKKLRRLLWEPVLWELAHQRLDLPDTRKLRHSRLTGAPTGDA